MIESVGFVLLVGTCGNDACDAIPVTENLAHRAGMCAGDGAHTKTLSQWKSFIAKRYYEMNKPENKEMKFTPVDIDGAHG
ncbi:hypothetical protein OIU92_27280 [Escherichia coli]|nr:hypothetical protein [Escherichia coli]